MGRVVGFEVLTPLESSNGINTRIHVRIFITFIYNGFSLDLYFREGSVTILLERLTEDFNECVEIILLKTFSIDELIEMIKVVKLPILNILFLITLEVVDEIIKVVERKVKKAYYPVKESYDTMIKFFNFLKENRNEIRNKTLVKLGCKYVYWV